MVRPDTHSLVGKGEFSTLTPQPSEVQTNMTTKTASADEGNSGGPRLHLAEDGLSAPAAYDLSLQAVCCGFDITQYDRGTPTFPSLNRG